MRDNSKKIVSFPHIGNLYVPMQVLFRQLDIEYVVPPFCNGRGMAWGSKYSPEFVCIPYKQVLGNYLEAVEMGANVLILLGGPGNCRFGYYSILQRKVFAELGHDVELLTPIISSRTISGVTDILKHMSPRNPSTWECVQAVFLALSVLHDIDEIERKLQWVRAREITIGSADKAFEKIAQRMSRVSGLAELKRVKKESLQQLDDLPIDRKLEPLRVNVVGEIYVVHEPYVNKNLEVELGKRRVEVTRAEQLSQWIVLSPALVLDALGLGHEARIARAAHGYLDHLHGETIGQTVMASRQNFDGVVHLAPFVCTPEIVNENILPRLRQDVDIPVLSLILDEHTAEAGLLVRVEAFVDLLERRRRTRGGVPARR